MSKYNIDDIVCVTPFTQACTQSKLTPPNAIRAFINKTSNVNKIVNEVNSICEITFLDTEGIIVFKPKLRNRVLKPETVAKTIYARNYVKKLLTDLGFDTYVYQDILYCSTVSLSLHKPKNQQRLQQLGNVFRFMYKSPVLTQSILDSMTQKKR
jgi:hypothetical protein